MSHENIQSILKDNFGTIISHVNTPIRLANDLYSVEMLPYPVRDRIVDDKTSTTYEKASILLNEVEKSFRVSTDDGVCAIRFNKLCNALVKQGNPELTTLVKQMKSSIVAASTQ